MIIEKIILIEDDELIREIYTFTLEKAGFVVIPAPDGQEGIDEIKKNPDANLILLDGIMPKMSGVDALKVIKSDSAIKDIPVILLSNLTDDKTVEEAMSLGAFGFIVKAQVSPAQLVEKIQEILSLHK